MVPVSGASEANASRSYLAGSAAGVVAVVVLCSAAGAVVDAWRARRRRDAQKQESGAPPCWAIGMLVSSYALLIPGLVSHLFESKTDLFGQQKVSQYDETTVSLVARLMRDHMVAGAVLVTLYAMVIPVLKLVLLGLGQYLQRGGPASVRQARQCIIVVQTISKWASPDMFAYILLMYLIRGLDNPPSVNSFMDLDLGFTCFSVFCVGSTVSCLGIRVPEVPQDEARSVATRSPWLGSRAAVAALVVLSAGFSCLLVVGLTTSSMSLHLDMKLLYEVKPELLPMKAVIDSMNLGALLRKEVSVWGCLGALCGWISEGEVNSFIAFILYAGFAVLLPILDMALLLSATALNLRSGAHPEAGRLSSSVLALSRRVRKLSMLDVSIMGCCVVSLSLAEMRKRGVIVRLCPGILALLGAELCHYAAAFVASRTLAAVEAGAVCAKDVSEEKGNSENVEDTASTASSNV